VEPRLTLALRRRRGRPVAPDQLAAEAGIPPKHFAKELADLAGHGFVIESHPLAGLRLISAPAHLCEAEIACDLAVSRVGRIVRCVESTSSTNDLAWQAAAEGPQAADGLAVFAEHQSSGRGRRGSCWLAPPHSSILCSVLVWMPDVPGQGAILTRAAAIAVAEAIEDQCREEVGIKWPNDLVIDDRKVAGILVESRPAGPGPGSVVIGVGINCDQEEEVFPAEIRRHAASLAMLGEEVDRTLLARAFLGRLDQVIGLMGEPSGVAEVRRRAAGRCRTIGRRISLREGDSTYTGEVVDLDPDYGLALRLADGRVQVFAAMTTHVAAQGE